MSCLMEENMLNESRLFTVKYSLKAFYFSVMAGVKILMSALTMEQYRFFILSLDEYLLFTETLLGSLLKYTKRYSCHSTGGKTKKREIMGDPIHNSAGVQGRNFMITDFLWVNLKLFLTVL